MDRYQRVEKPKADTPINENEIRITTQGRMRNYITYATTLLQVLFLFLESLAPFPPIGFPLLLREICESHLRRAEFTVDAFAFFMFVSFFLKVYC